MANELKDALDQVKTLIAAISGVQRAELGPCMDALPDTDESNCVVFIELKELGLDDICYAATGESHFINISFYWLLTKYNKEIVEQSLASTWDLIMTALYVPQAGRNLNAKATLFMVGGEDGKMRATTGYDDPGTKLHRVLTVPCEIKIHTHATAT